MEEFIKIERLKGKETFQLWKLQINAIFKSLGLLNIVRGKYARPESKVDEMAEWDKKDGAAQKYILTTVDKRLITHIMNCETAEVMMNKLQEIFEKGDTKKKCTLIQEFYEISYNKSDSISEYISKVENLAQRINGIEENSIKDDMIIAKILTTLPENYEPFVSAWESTESNNKHSQI